VPALNPDVALVHVHRADRYGNAQIDGYPFMDVDMVGAARRVVVSAEEIVEPEVLRRSPRDTLIPHFAVDAVVEARHGAYPHECYGRYEVDTEHFAEYVDAVGRDGVAGARGYVNQHVATHADFAGFLDSVGVERLRARERAAQEMVS
jgi:glutaconate CoA-transferase subunit A